MVGGETGQLAGALLKEKLEPRKIDMICRRLGIESGLEFQASHFPLKSSPFTSFRYGLGFLQKGQGMPSVSVRVLNNHTGLFLESLIS